MITITMTEVELLAGLLQRAGVTPIETLWANMVLSKLRSLAAQFADEAATARNEAQGQTVPE